MNITELLLIAVATLITIVLFKYYSIKFNLINALNNR
jgi:hypothetical protein